MADDQSSYETIDGLQLRRIFQNRVVANYPSLSPFSPPLYRDGSPFEGGYLDEERTRPSTFEGKEGKKDLYPPSRERGGKR